MSDYVFANTDELIRITEGKKISVFLDFDGTLTPIVSIPEKAFLTHIMKQMLARLSSACRVVVLSGRSMDDMRERIGIPDIFCVANNGLQIAGSGIDFTVEEALKGEGHIHEAISKVKETVKREKIRGVVLEDKGLTGSIHFRLMDKRDTASFVTAVKTLVMPYIEEGQISIFEGRKVIELRPNVRWGKDGAVDWIMKQEGFKGTFPIYVGDDVTDVDVFRMMKGRGLSISIGPRFEDADFHLRGQSEIRRLINLLDDMAR